jgi:hypothetical protein
MTIVKVKKYNNEETRTKASIKESIGKGLRKRSIKKIRGIRKTEINRQKIIKN